MEKTIVAATGNKHKIKEIEAITAEFGMSIISKDEAGVPDVEIVEDGETFEENSYKKAYEIMKLCAERQSPMIRDWSLTVLMALREYIPPDSREQMETTTLTTGS